MPCDGILWARPVCREYSRAYMHIHVSLLHVSASAPASARGAVLLPPLLFPFLFRPPT